MWIVNMVQRGVEKMGRAYHGSLCLTSCLSRLGRSLVSKSRSDRRMSETDYRWTDGNGTGDSVFRPEAGPEVARASCEP